GSVELVRAIGIQSDGKIVAVGDANPSEGVSGVDMAIARYDAQGNPDLTFNGTGRRFIPVGAGTASDGARGVTFQPGGKIVLGGSAESTGNDAFALVRLESNGALDDGGVSDPVPGDHFGSGGMVTLALTAGE